MTVKKLLFKLQEALDQTDQSRLYLNQHQLEMLGLSEAKTANFQVGTQSCEVKVVLDDGISSDSTLFVSTKVWSKFPYYQGEPLQLIFCCHDKLVVGPTIGLTVSPKVWRGIDKSMAIKRRAQIALEEGVLLYCFLMNKVDWNNNQVLAYSLQPKTRCWIKQCIPVPQVFYDRGTYPRSCNIYSFDQKDAVKELLWINNVRTLGKWETYCALSSAKHTVNSVPETAMFSPQKLDEFLSKYEYTFVKGNYGRNANEVFRVEKAGKGYRCKTGGVTVSTWDFSDFEELCCFFASKLDNRIIVQQGLDLSKIKHSPFDLRVLVQKNSNGHWVVSGVNQRIAARRAIVTNYSAGARDIFIPPGGNLDITDLSWNRLEAFAFEIIQVLELYFGQLGEIGLDICLDSNSKLWLIEANSRPSSIAYRNACEDDLQRIFGLPLDYGVTLIHEALQRRL